MQKDRYFQHILMLEQRSGVPRRRAGYANVCNLEWIFLPLKCGSQDRLPHVSSSCNEKPVRPSTVSDRRHKHLGKAVSSVASRHSRTIIRSEERRVGKECRSRWSLKN